MLVSRCLSIFNIAAASSPSEPAIFTILTRLWRSVDVTRIRETIPGFLSAAVPVIHNGYQESARVAGLYYLLRRPQGVTTLTLPTVPLPPIETTTDVLRGAAISGIVNGRRAGQTIERAAQNGLVKTLGSASNVILAGGRDAMLQATRDDPVATGWRWVAAGDACPYCQSFAGGGVYSGDQAIFASHDHCACAALPEFK